MQTIDQAKEIINNFLDNGVNVIYVVNPDGSTFTLEKGCLLLAVDNSHMQTLEKEVKDK